MLLSLTLTNHWVQRPVSDSKVKVRTRVTVKVRTRVTVKVRTRVKVGVRNRVKVGVRIRRFRMLY